MSKKKKVININYAKTSWAGKIIIVFIVVYIIALIVSYMTKNHITIYEVNNTKISDDVSFTGVVLRKEEVYNAPDDGYVNYFIPSGNRVGVGQLLYLLDSSGSISSTISDLESQNEVSEEDITHIRDTINTYQANYDSSHFNEVYNYMYDINNSVFELTKPGLYSDLNKVLSKSGNTLSYTKEKAFKTGIISYCVDGMESLKANQITRATFQKESSINKKQLQTAQAVHKGNPVYKLVTDDEWSMVVPISKDYFDRLANKKTVNITIQRDNLSFLVSIAIGQGSDGEYYATLTSSRYMQRYINDRFLEIEFNLNSASGLKIPNNSIFSKDFYVVPEAYVTKGGNSNNSGVLKTNSDGTGSSEFKFEELSNLIYMKGNYYVSNSVLHGGDTLLDKTTGQKLVVSNTEKLKGVYQTNDGTCTFKRIEELYHNSEYAIVSAQTANGLSEYDHIVINPSKLQEDDFIK